MRDNSVVGLLRRLRANSEALRKCRKPQERNGHMKPTITRTTGTYAVTVSTPYNDNFIRSIKRWLPLRSYKWDRKRNTWQFTEGQIDAVTKLLELHYGGYEMQEECTQ